jgi:hypothetical protein
MNKKGLKAFEKLFHWSDLSTLVTALLHSRTNIFENAFLTAVTPRHQ